VVLGTVAALALSAASSSPAFAAESITVTSTGDGLGAGTAGQCTLRDALVVADEHSNPALMTGAEPGGIGADGDCAGDVSGSGSPYMVKLATGTT
jgi:hypothetical protein